VAFRRPVGAQKKLRSLAQPARPVHRQTHHVTWNKSTSPSDRNSQTTMAQECRQFWPHTRGPRTHGQMRNSAKNSTTQDWYNLSFLHSATTPFQRQKAGQDVSHARYIAEAEGKISFPEKIKRQGKKKRIGRREERQVKIDTQTLTSSLRRLLITRGSFASSHQTVGFRKAFKCLASTACEICQGMTAEAVPILFERVCGACLRTEVHTPHGSSRFAVLSKSRVKEVKPNLAFPATLPQHFHCRPQLGHDQMVFDVIDQCRGCSCRTRTFHAVGRQR
jgi:hypothetical protein